MLKYLSRVCDFFGYVGMWVVSTTKLTMSYIEENCKHNTRCKLETPNSPHTVIAFS